MLMKAWTVLDKSLESVALSGFQYVHVGRQLKNEVQPA